MRYARSITSLVLIAIAFGMPASVHADRLVTTDTVQNSGTFVVNPAGTLIVDNPINNPLLTLTNGAGTSGIQQIYIGGTGQLLVEDGSTLQSGSATLGNSAGSNGIATVTGTGSKWQNYSDLYVGYQGNGTLTVSDGGEVSTKTLYATLANLYGNGTISTKGVLLDADIQFNSSSQAQQTLAFGSGGKLNIDLTSKIETLGVGYKAAGSLTVSNGAQIKSYGGYLGSNAGSTGTATISGVGSTWEQSASFIVGDSGSGKLLIENGGTVKSDNSSIGARYQSTGAAAVNGAGSTWLNKGALVVGADGSGTLDIEDGGLVTSGLGFVGSYYGVGSVTIAGEGSQWKNSQLLSVGVRGYGSIDIENGGVLTSKGAILGVYGNGTVTVAGPGSRWENSGSLQLSPSFGSSKLIVKDGGFVSNGEALIASDDAASGEVLVSGAGSKWQIGDNLFLGNDQGTGTLTIEEGGSVTGLWGIVGNWYGKGIIRVAGAGSELTMTNSLSIGGDPDSSMSIEGGGVVNSGYGSVAGTVTITGENSQWNSGAGLFVGGLFTGNLTIENGGKATSNFGDVGGNVSNDTKGIATVSGSGSEWQINGNQRVGDTGEGTLSILNGALVDTTGNASMGTFVDSTSKVIVDGTNTQWNIDGRLTLASYGSGKLIVTNGGNVNAGEIFASLKDLEGNGTVNAYGAVLDADLSFSTGSEQQQTFDFGSGGTLKLDLRGGEHALGAGFKGQGSLLIAEGQQIQSSEGYLGYLAGSKGTATVTGPGSQWNINQNLQVGNDGDGALAIENGAAVTSGDGFIGSGSSTGKVTVDGAGSDWSNRRVISVNGLETSSLTIQNGAHVSSNEGNVGTSGFGISGEVTVSGSGSQWQNTNGLTIGDNYGEGSLTIEKGGLAINSWGHVGGNGTGTVTVSGKGSQWFMTGQLGLYSFSGTATLNITDGGLVSSDSGSVGYLDSSNIKISGDGSTWQISDYLTLDGGKVVIADGGSLKTVNSYVSSFFRNYENTITVTGNHSKWQNDENISLGINGIASLIVQNGGTVEVGGILTVGTEGTLAGDGGAIQGDVLNEGLIAPGNSPGILTIDGDLSNTGIAQFELAGIGTGLFDQLIVTGELNLAGVIEIDLIDGFNPTAGSSFKILTFGSLIDSGFTFDLTHATLAANLSWDTSTFATDGTLRVVPEASSLMLAGIATFAGVVIGRKSRRCVVKTLSSHPL